MTNAVSFVSTKYIQKQDNQIAFCYMDAPPSGESC